MWLGSLVKVGAVCKAQIITGIIKEGMKTLSHANPPSKVFENTPPAHMTTLLAVSNLEQTTN